MGAAGSIQSPRNGTSYMQVEDDIKKKGHNLLLVSNKLVRQGLRHPQVKLDRLLILNHDPKHITYIGPTRLADHLPYNSVPYHNPSFYPFSFSKFKANKLKNKMTNHWDEMENDSRTRLPLVNMSHIVKM
ncbi:hypothetical protein O3M35_000956 [Rhynocoris fuscipes]|uniref:Uncharacterized protein n=1 Tax=Rhynocoris fuscipes TaxID=488301 RepID=A0AAW1DTN8_9HEMI